MLTDHSRRSAGLRNGVLVLAAAAMLALAVAAPALATPKGDFAVFAQCPLKNPEVNVCVFAQTTSGEFQIGNSKVPIKKTVTLQGGIIDNEVTEAETFVEAANGDTLSKTPLVVPGGLLGVVAPEALPKWLREIFNKIVSEGITEVTATAELVGTPTINRLNLLANSGVALTLPTRVHLENLFLGSGCYLGSKSHPVELELTDGTTKPPKPNEPITGAFGEIEFKDEFTLAVINGNKLVDNSFSAPKVEGCGGLLSLLVDPAVNLKLGLPSEGGHNTAILEGSLENTSAEAVVNSEK